MSIQAKNPSLDIAFWNQSGNLIVLDINALLSDVLQCLIELPPSILNGMSVCIDNYNERSFGVTSAVFIHFREEGFPHPSFGVPPA